MLQRLPPELRTHLLGYRLYGTGIYTSPGWTHKYRHDPTRYFWTICEWGMGYGPHDPINSRGVATLYLFNGAFPEPFQDVVLSHCRRPLEVLYEGQRYDGYQESRKQFVPK